MTTDSAGNVVATIKYFPFGGTRLQTGDLDTDKKFTGQRLDDTGLYYYNARYYDATIGRFISPDTIVQDMANPQTLNRYAYCNNNPLKYVDPSGHGWWSKLTRGQKWIVGICFAVVAVAVVVTTVGIGMAVVAVAAEVATAETLGLFAIGLHTACVLGETVAAPALIAGAAMAGHEQDEALAREEASRSSTERMDQYKPVDYVTTEVIGGRLVTVDYNRPNAGLTQEQLEQWAAEQNAQGQNMEEASYVGYDYVTTETIGGETVTVDYNQQNAGLTDEQLAQWIAENGGTVY